MPQLITHINNLAWREASIAATPELSEKRLQMISKNPNCLRRLGAKSVYVVAHYAAQPVIKLLSTPFERHDMAYVGSGWNSTVVQHGAEVLKIVRATELATPEARTAEAQRLQELIERNVACHPEIAIASNVQEIPHPLSRKPVIAIIQPHIDGIDALTTPPTRAVQKQLRAFAEKSLDEMIPEGFAPDLVGAGNILVSADETGEERIHLVDTVALENLPVPYAAYPHSVKKLTELTRL